MYIGLKDLRDGSVSNIYFKPSSIPAGLKCAIKRISQDVPGLSSFAVNVVTFFAKTK